VKDQYLLQTKGISKSFGGVRALQKVDLNAEFNEILAVVGDNGAGKSTLMKVISGAILPDEGRIFFEGKEVSIKSPRDAAGLGIQMGYQDLALVDTLDVATNIFLGREICTRLFGFIDILRLNRMRADSINHLRDLGVDLRDVRKKVKNLSGGQRQVIAISRAVYWGKKLIILDEPTAALGVREAGKVNELIRSLTGKNISVIVISHNLQHVFSIADRVVVLRHGMKAGERIIKETNVEEVVKLITGGESQTPPRVESISDN
jgi:ABC-type sugar transport system ATPase subunit